MSAPSTEVGPGFLAFVVFFFLAVVLWLLMRSMFTRVRRMNLAQRAQEQQEQEQEAARGAGTPTSADAADERPAGERDSALGDGAEEGQRRGDEV
ncbi:hypothetical protein O9K63_08395 [Janibacter cremeus]|uniref:hypothetical protein n=1 Tax=Janibacter cremeus TaxID=1285192 RepID=UPI0023F8ABB6|nr:hypothetical protein [Janibacter cremeus]WEV76634.1 hypothetical protein O9K63_08395 [Janibacter cremeus]